MNINGHLVPASENELAAEVFAAAVDERRRLRDLALGTLATIEHSVAERDRLAQHAQELESEIDLLTATAAKLRRTPAGYIDPRRAMLPIDREPLAGLLDGLDGGAGCV